MFFVVVLVVNPNLAGKGRSKTLKHARIHIKLILTLSLTSGGPIGPTLI
jgi:hypothetical protein